MARLRVFPVAMAGGVQESKIRPEPGDFETLENVAIYRGRLGLRSPLEEIATIQDDQGTPADVTGILDILQHGSKMWVVSHSTVTDKVYLHSLNVDGTSVTLEAVVWSSVPTEPIVTTTSFQGGTASSGTSRIYIADYNQGQDTVYWDGSSIDVVSEDFNNDGSDEPVKFSIVFPYQFHMWGSGFFEDTTTRAEMLRFSQPGLVPGNDIAGGSNPKEWFSADHREVGIRGDKITCIDQAGDRMVVYQENATHAIFGQGADTWTKKYISKTVGCVGPHASASADGKAVFWWGANGPYMSDGENIQYIGHPIRSTIVGIEADEKTKAAYSPDDGLVYFFVSDAGEDTYDRALVYDVRRTRWVSNNTQWAVASFLECGGIGGLEADVPPPPDGDPSSLTATSTGTTTVDLSWSNGDTNVSTVTHIYRSTSSGFSPDDATNKIDQVGSGQTSYSDSGLSSNTTYYYQVRHFRNNQHSSASGEASAQTDLQAPSGLSDSALSSSHQLSYTQNEGGTDIEIQRKTSGGSFSTITTETSVGAGAATYEDTTAVCGTSYVWRVRSVSGARTSAWSNETTGTACEAATVPSDPSSLTLTRTGDFEFDLSWTDNSSDEDGFEVHRSTDGSNFSLYATLGANVTAYEDTSLSSGVTYYYKVRAFNDAGSSGFSNTDSAIAGSAPTAPSSLSATVDGSTVTTINLSWTDNSSNEDNFQVYRSTDGGSTYSLLATKNAGSTSHSDTGLNEDTQYCYKVRASNNVGTSNFSNSDCATTGTSGSAPTAPSGLTATANGTDQIDLSWTDNSDDEDSFEIFRDSGSGYSLHDTVAADQTTYSDTGLTSSTQYCYTVRATNSFGDSAQSAEDCATTDADVQIPTGFSASDTSYCENTGSEEFPVFTARARVELNWTNDTDLSGVTNVQIHRKAGGGSYSLYDTVAVGSAGGSQGVSYDHDASEGSLSIGTQYCWKIRYDSGGTFTSEDCVTPTQTC